MKYSQTMKLDRSFRRMTKKHMQEFFNRSTGQLHRRIDALEKTVAHLAKEIKKAKLIVRFPRTKK
jgi:hypothetical protein